MMAGGFIGRVARTLRGLPVPVLHRLPGTAGGIALTIDDGPTEGATPAILEALARHRAHATFFVSGRRAEARPDLVEAMIKAGHDVCNHGYEHVRLDRLDAPEVAANLERAERILSAQRRTPSPYPVRLPFGEGWRNPNLHRALLSWRPDVRIIHWTRHAHDWEIAGRCTGGDDIDRECARAASELVGRRVPRGAILLAHDHPIDSDHCFADAVAVGFIDHVLRALSQSAIRTVPLHLS